LRVNRWEVIDTLYLHAGMDAMLQLPASFDNKEPLLTTERGFLL
jgi:hypothetical protein